MLLGDPVYIECDQVECSNNCNAESNTVCAQSAGEGQCTCVCKAGFSGSPCQGQAQFILQCLQIACIIAQLYIV